jgi:DnaK suppressor protein
VDPERARELLAAERRRIEEQLAKLDGDGPGPDDDGDTGDEAADLYQDELDEGLRSDLEARLAAVTRAEERLAAGTYGLSVESGEPIPAERLEALPWAERTAGEEERLR